LDLPFLFKKPELYEAMTAAYKRGDVSFIIPPKPFLGAKGALALLRNDTGNPGVEAITKAFIRSRSLELVRGYIPETVLVGKRAASNDEAKRRVAEKRHVLKESISSGMKGTVFSDEDGFATTLERAGQSYMSWILQEEVANQPQRFSWFVNGEGNEPRIETADDWFMRVTVHYVNRKLADVIVTARRDKAVHGGKDCLQLGTRVLCT
ncbi:MAG: hypothetical protein WC767_02880, partial [Candidatus Paceibacterota bacterium]